MTTRYLLLAWLALPLTAGCASDGSSGPGPGSPDASTAPTADARGDGGGGGNGPDAAPATVARLTGSITRSASPSGDAVGNVYVALFDQDPIAHKDTAKVVGNALIRNVDLAASGATVAYAVEDVPPRAEAYYLIAFLDDNANVDMTMPASAGPDKGDLVSLTGVSAPKVMLTTPGAHAQDIDLNLVMPF